MPTPSTWRVIPRAYTPETWERGFRGYVGDAPAPDGGALPAALQVRRINPSGRSNGWCWRITFQGFDGWFDGPGHLTDDEAKAAALRLHAQVLP